MNFITKFDHYLEKTISYLLIIIVFTMLFLSVAVIILRWFNITFFWYDPFIRHLVFISAFFGGVIAIGRGNHIAIDILNKFLENKNLHNTKNKINSFINTISGLALLWPAHASYKFVLIEMKYGKISFWEIHSGMLVAIIPIGFIILSLRFFLRGTLCLQHKGPT